MAQQKKAKKVGRPRLPKGAAKGKIVPVRFAADDIKLLEKAAKKSGKTVSEWVRSELQAVLRAGNSLANQSG